MATKINPVFEKRVVEVRERRQRVFCRDDVASADTNVCNRRGNVLGIRQTRQ